MKKQIFALSFLIVITLGLSAGAVYERTHRQDVTNAAVLKAQKQRDDALNLASAYKLNLTSANAQAQSLTGQKVVLCADLTKAKVVEPLCQTPKE